MRNISNILLKLMGVFFLYWTMTNLIALVIIIVQPKSLQEFKFFYLYNLIAIIIQTFISLTFSYFLLMKTEKVSKSLGFIDEDVKIGSISSDALLKIGFKLIGMYIFISQIDKFLKTIVLRIMSKTSDKVVDLPGQAIKMIDRTTSISEIVVQSIPIIIALILIFGTNETINKQGRCFTI